MAFQIVSKCNVNLGVKFSKYICINLHKTLSAVRKVNYISKKNNHSYFRQVFFINNDMLKFLQKTTIKKLF